MAFYFNTTTPFLGVTETNYQESENFQSQNSFAVKNCLPEKYGLNNSQASIDNHYTQCNTGFYSE